MEKKQLANRKPTRADMIRQALAPQALGDEADTEAVREWIEQKYPFAQLDDQFPAEVDRIRCRIRADAC